MEGHPSVPSPRQRLRVGRGPPAGRVPRARERHRVRQPGQPHLAARQPGVELPRHRAASDGRPSGRSVRWGVGPPRRLPGAYPERLAVGPEHPVVGGRCLVDARCRLPGHALRGH
ncbi:hypothetical protein, partial [Micromonospora sonneratiae]